MLDVLFFLTLTATTAIYTYGITLSLHDALPMLALRYLAVSFAVYVLPPLVAHAGLLSVDAETAVAMLVVAYRLGGAIHCERVARRRAGEIPAAWGSEAHTSELQLLMRYSYDVFCLNNTILTNYALHMQQ